MSTLLPRSALPGVLLRIGVAAALLVLAFRLALPSDTFGRAGALAAAWTAGIATALVWFGLACAILGLSFAVGTWRFHLLLRGGGFVSDWPPLLRAYVVAGFFNIVLPGAILGDVYRVWDARRDLGRGSELLGLVALERLLSLAALGSIAILAAPALPLADGDEHLAWLLVGLGGIFVLATLGALHPVPNRWLRRALSPLRRLSDRTADHLDRLDRALKAVLVVAGRPTVVLHAYLLSLLAQGLPVAAVFALSMPLDASVSWLWYPVIVPFVTLISLVPISIGGAGVRESLYVTFFGAVGMRAPVALTLSLSAFAASLVWGLIGLGLFTLGRRRVAAVTARADSPF